MKDASTMPDLLIRSLVLEIQRLVFVMLVLGGCQGYLAGQGSALKTYTPDDMLRKEELGGTAFSSDGESLAYVIKRGKLSGAVDPLLGLNNNEHADIWVTSINGGPTINITNGVVDGSGYWAPRWSPDGEKLAFNGIKKGKIQIYLWSKKTKQLTALTNRNVAVVALENS